ncbi:MAG: CocE/NonD family hydrolase [Gemmatimonadetes bacterium]|nr:CocE/NonD family hydrolase [Gemmatimonadota bacterium]MBT5146571.1 CocE/NonD family hydrolase [Gemmatimonadota bacterium]MBT7452990.1 CocE/NonD family hydrolase [Gemmatimonadota bacterium]
MIEFELKNGVRFIKDVRVPMADGIELSLDMHVPDEGDWQQTPRPLLLEYIPYRKDDSPAYSSYHNSFAEHGIIGARLDCRGSGASGGVTADEYTEQEQADGAAAIEWLATQSWCTGKVGMIGASYGGFTAVQIAALAPEHLTTIIPIYFTDDRYTDDCHYRGGAMRCYYDIGAYGASMIGMNAMPPYPEYSGQDWAGLWEEHLEQNTPYLLTWLRNQTDGPYWRPGSIRDRYQDVRCSVFMIGGWRDGYPNPPLRTFEHLTVPKRLLMGPWNHTRPNAAIPGPRIDYVNEVLRWCDHWLKGEDNGVMDEPAVQVYIQSFDEPRADRTQTSGYWRAEDELPTGAQSWRLASEGQLLLKTDEDAAAEADSSDFDSYRYNPTVGTSGGLWSGGVPYGLPTDQRADEINSLTYTTQPLEQPLEILGQGMVSLHVRTTATVMAFVVRLSDIAPDGTSALVCTGVLNGTRRESLEDPQPMTPGEMYALDIKLDATGWRFGTGHCLRLSVCSADFPNLWPTPYAGTNEIFFSSEHPSSITLPAIPVRQAVTDSLPPSEIDFEPGEDAEPYRQAPNEQVWEIIRDVMGRRTGMAMQQNGVSRISDEMEVRNQRSLMVWASEDDPANVSAKGRHTRHIVRHDGVTVVDSICHLRSTVEAFHCTIDLSVTIDALPHAQRRWVESFPRQLL